MKLFCINCKHSRANTYGSYGSTVKFNCYNPWIIQSPVDGEQRIRTCELERSKIGTCGPYPAFYEEWEEDKEDKENKTLEFIKDRTVDYSLW